ncbi:B3 domain-containing protein At1g32030-like [Aristolochia californica]|uniref:B3 domain-containing protein At1g32030-like n=1 Tax=Aristolochia californica TaxID=171875 RepID=UPI0035E1DE59
MAESGTGKRELVTDEEADLLAFLEKKRLKLEEEERQPKRRAAPELLQSLAMLYSDFTEPVWLGQKRLTRIDIHPHYQRFLILRSVVQKLKPLLTCWERGEIEPDDGPGIYVPVMDPLGWRRELKLKRWPSLAQWALIQGWQVLVDVNELREGDHILIWEYRHGPNNQLGLILQRIPLLLFNKKDDMHQDSSR